jgi:hypothetical protein
MKRTILQLIIIGLISTVIGCQKDPIPESSGITMGEVSSITGSSAVLSGTYVGSASKVTKYGVCVSTQSNPTINDVVTYAQAAFTNDFSCEITGLEKNTTYYAKLFVGNDVIISYSEEITFTTSMLCTVETGEVSNILASEVFFKGEVKSNGNSVITEYGVCWATTELPTIDDNKESYPYNTVDVFQCKITQLEPETKYFYRAFAVNSAGVAYGAQKSFTTTKAPKLQGLVISGIGADNIVCNDVVIDTVDSDVKTVGFCWNETGNPVPEANNTVEVVRDENGAISGTIWGLQGGTTYYVRPFIKSTQGLTYGNEIECKTLSIPELSIYNVYSITKNTAMEGAVIVDNGGAAIEEKGFCWSTEENPTIEDSKISVSTDDKIFYGQMDGLLPATMYYVRAYAKNKIGIAYSSNATFVTK